MNVNMKAQTSMGLICKRLETPKAEPLHTSYDAQVKMLKKADQAGKVIMPLSVFAGSMYAAPRVFAANVDIMEGLWPIIELLQGFALPVGIGIATWGLIEIMIGNPGGKTKLKYAVGGYIGIFLVPYLFITLRDALSGLGGM